MREELWETGIGRESLGVTHLDTACEGGTVGDRDWEGEFGSYTP